MAAATVDKVVAEDTVDKPVEHMEDEEGVFAIGVEDMVHSPKRRKVYLRLAIKLPHSLVEEQEHRQHQILSNASTIGTIVSCVFLM